MTINELALLEILGVASEEQRNILATVTMRTCEIVAHVAVRNKKIAKDDIDEVVQNASIKAFSRKHHWDQRKAGWLQFVSVIANSCVGDIQRRYKKEINISCNYLNYMEIFTQNDDNQ